MVFYFSGTGNSQMAAKQIAQGLEDELVCVNRQLRSGEAGSFHSERPLVFVSPTYAWRIPRPMERWIRAASFTGATEAYFVLTCGDGCGNAVRYARQLCRAKGLTLRGLAPVVMPENYLALFPTPDTAQAEELLEKAQPRIAALARLIGEGQPFPGGAVTLAGRLESGPVNPLFYRFSVGDKGFWVTDGCTGCGRCVRRCPMNNIRLSQKGQPVWLGSCTHCMGCIAGCPTGAIEYKNKSAGRPRYDRMEGDL